MATDMRKARAEKLAQEANNKYGQKAATVGRHDFGSNYFSTGSPTVDYMLGTGGVPDNAFTEVFGPPEIGKTTIFGAGILSSVQKAGGLTATIATEPDFDEDWIAEHGVNPDFNVVYRPDTGEEAFELARDLIFNRKVDYILWDSLAGTSSSKEQNSDKPQAYGNASLNSWGIRNIAVRAWKNQVGVTFINQIRDDTEARIRGMVKSPGGHAIEHFMKIRLQLKMGKQRYTIKVPSTDSESGTEALMVGNEVRTVIVKNKASQQLGKQAVFDFYFIETDEYPFGFDPLTDTLNVAKVSGVITGSGWLHHEVFPGGKINGMAKAREFFRHNEVALEKVRGEVMSVAKVKSAELAEKKRKAKSA